MMAINGRITTGLVAAFLVCFLAVEFAEAGRRGGGGRGMARGGPAAGGSFNRSMTRPQRSPSSNRMNRGVSDRGNYGTRGDRTINQDRADQIKNNNQDRYDQRQDRLDQRQDNIDNRQDFAKEVHNDRKEYYNDRQEWYEDRWRRGSYVTVYSWSSMGCVYDPVIVGTDRYYDCRGVRYSRVSRGGEVVFIAVP